MPLLTSKLELARCPHCSVNRPNLAVVWNGSTNNHAGNNGRAWCAYSCANCGGVVTAWSRSSSGAVEASYPSAPTVDEDLPEPAKSYLAQAIDSLHAPAGAVMLCASAVDAMLRAKDLDAGTLFERIKRAAEIHLITDGMAQWAHAVRLDANDQRHADKKAGIPTEAEAQRSIDFTSALGQFLFVLPKRIERGLDPQRPVVPSSA